MALELRATQLSQGTVRAKTFSPVHHVQGTGSPLLPVKKPFEDYYCNHLAVKTGS